jgi:hypothetical protein
MKRVLAIAAVAAAMAVSPAFLTATTVLPLTFDQLVAQAELIFESVVVDVRSRTLDVQSGQLIVTDVSLRAVKAHKGNVPLLVVLPFLGGTVGNVTMHVADMPRFTPGDRDIIFARAGRPDASPIAGFNQGRFRIVVDAHSGSETIRQFDRAPVSSAAQIGLPSQPFFSRSAAMSLSDFEKAVAAEVARQQGVGRR